MLKLITTKSVTAAAAAIIAAGMAIFFIRGATGKGAAAGPAPTLSTSWPRATAFVPW